MTGGAGFIGSHLVDRLISEGYDVRVIDDLSTGKLGNISSHIGGGRLDFVKGDIRDVPLVRESLKGVGVVVHLAAQTSVPFSVLNPDLTFDINLLGTQNLLRSSVKEHVDRFVFASSCAVYGDPKVLPVVETCPTNPISPYAESKLLGERYCLGFNDQQRLGCVVLRFLNVYGPRQGMNDYSGVITRFIEFSKQGVPLVIYGDGSATRDFVSVQDVVDAILSTRKNSGVEGEILNIGSGIPTSIFELAKMVIELSGVDLEICYEKSRAGDIAHSYADVSKARKFLDYEPKVSLRNGLSALIEESARH